MNKKELISSVSDKTGLNKNEAKKALEAVIESITEEIKQDGKVILIGFGTFSVKLKAARKSVNPQTMAPMDIPAKKCVRFKPSDSLNSLLVQKKKRGRPRIGKQAEQ